ncbi:MAG TPA: DUF1064 domain-containing protein [Panacibacter sp.]|nr:DUF1064 domain-containing protein [Panacibacter sp.]
MNRTITIDDILNSAAGARNRHLQKTEDKKKRSKYNAQRINAEGMEFDSRKEAKRYRELKILLKEGIIMFLATQVEFSFQLKGQKIASYYADFVYQDIVTGDLIVEDVKSDATRKLPVYRLKKKMMLVQHGIKIKEV